MKYIRLLSPAYSNNGRFLDAGMTIEVGEEGAQITEERADEITKGLRGEEVDVVDEALGGEEGEEGKPAASKRSARSGNA